VQWGPKMQNVYNNSKEKIEQKKRKKGSQSQTGGVFLFVTALLYLSYSTAIILLKVIVCFFVLWPSFAPQRNATAAAATKDENIYTVIIVSAYSNA
jgi:hypothetical protein